MAPGRATRPGAARHTLEPPGDEELADCPFCEGREDRTPPEVLTLGPSGAEADRSPNTPGWLLRVVPNLYPALERQEVVVHVPRHARSLTDLSSDELSRVAEGWRLRAAAARAEGFTYLQALVNEGRSAGASLPHSHSQLAWFRDHPPGPASERTAKGDCGVCELVRAELDAGVRVLGDSDGAVSLCHPAGRLPYELLIAPLAHEPEPWPGRRLEAALDLAVTALRQLQRAEGPVPLNLWLHCAPFGGDGHWHLEVVPRLTVLAGLELGAGIYVNSLAPEQAAATLRAAAGVARSAR